MPQRFRAWLSSLTYPTPLQQRQAELLQIMLLFIIGACFVGLAISFLTAGRNALATLAGLAYPLLLVCAVGALIQLRRGRFNIAVNLLLTGFMVALGLALLATGVKQSPGVLLAFSIPISLAGLVLGRRGLALAGGSSLLLVLGTALLQTFAPAQVGTASVTAQTPMSIAISFILITSVLILFLDRFGTSLRDALSATQAREHELDRLRASLEHTVIERTASLTQALQDVEQREAHLAQSIGDLKVSQETIRGLSAPVIPVLPGVLVTPVIGELDYARAALLTNNVLAMVERENARYVLFDITGVPVVDTQVAQVLLQTAAAVRLLGAQAMLVGIRPEVAQTLIALNIDLGAIGSYPNLQDAVEKLLVERYHVDLARSGKAA